MTDALRAPAHKFAAGAGGQAVADLVFLDREQSATAFRTCVVRRVRGGRGIRTCFGSTSGRAGSVTVTPLRFQRGRYVVRWRVAGATVARWRFVVV